MKIAIFGCGNMGRTLGQLWREAGHAVFFASGDLEKARALAATPGPPALFGNYDEAANFAEVVLYTARGCPPAQLMQDPDRLRNRVIIDCNNCDAPFGFDFRPRPGPSLAEELAELLPLSPVVKAFNMHAQELYEMEPGELRSRKVTSFLCGDKEPPKLIVEQLIEDAGLSPWDLGPLRRSYMLETLADFLRTLMLEQQIGMTATLLLRVLPEHPEGDRLGGRQPTYQVVSSP